jgi:hypothetical protein
VPAEQDASFDAGQPLVTPLAKQGGSPGRFRRLAFYPGGEFRFDSTEKK